MAPGEVISRWRPFIFVEDTKGRRLIVYWRRLGLYLAALGLVGWLTAAGVVWATLRHRHHFPELSYLNIVLPFRWAEHRRTVGRHYITQGRQALDENRPQEALFHLRTGLHRVPDDTETRQLLAALYLRFGRPALARELLLVRIKEERQNLPYLRATCDLLAQANQDEAIVKLARDLLPSPPTTDQPAAEYLALQAAQAFFRLGNPAAAKDLLRTWRLEQSARGILLLAENERTDGYPQLAVLRLKAASARFPHNSELSLALLRLLLSLEQTEDARQLALQRYAANPASPGARIDLLHFYVLDRDAARLDRETAGFVRDHAPDRRALMLLADLAVRTAQPSIALRARETAVQAGHPAHNFNLAEVETLIRASAFPAALAALERASADPAPRRDTLLTGLRSVIAQHQHDAAALGYLGNFLTQKPAPAESFNVAQLFSRIGEPRLASRVLREAVASYPTNRQLLIRLVELATEIGELSDLEAHLPRLQALPNPPQAIVEAAALKLTTLQIAAREAAAEAARVVAAEAAAEAVRQAAREAAAEAARLSAAQATAQTTSETARLIAAEAVRQAAREAAAAEAAKLEASAPLVGNRTTGPEAPLPSEEKTLAAP